MFGKVPRRRAAVGPRAVLPAGADEPRGRTVEADSFEDQGDLQMQPPPRGHAAELVPAAPFMTRQQQLHRENRENRENTVMRSETTTGTYPSSDLHVESMGRRHAGGARARLAGHRRPRSGRPSDRSPTRAFACWCPTAAATGAAPRPTGEDFLRDAEDIAELMGDGAHLVGHSYGGLGAMFAAARRPEATLSLTLLEPARIRAGPGPPRRAGARRRRARACGTRTSPTSEWVVRLPEGGRQRSRRVPARVPRRRGAARAGVPPRPADLVRRPAAGRAGGRRRSPSSSCPAATAPGSTPSATTSPSGSAPPGRWSRAPATRSSSPATPINDTSAGALAHNAVDAARRKTREQVRIPAEAARATPG